MAVSERLSDKSTKYLKSVRTVAVYIRKSRLNVNEDEEDTLAKHRRQLLSFVHQQEFEYDVFEEVASGTSIDGRNEFKRLLTLVEAGAYDALVIINLDRLTRGDDLDKAKIKRAIKDSDTLIIQLDPFEIIDLNDEADFDKASFATFFAEWEARQIKRRMKAGKVRAALQGKWANPTVPYGYKRNSKTGYLEIIEKEATILRRICDEFMNNGKNPREISYILNKENIPSPKGIAWRDKAIREMLKDEVYTGTAIYGKAKYPRRGIKINKPREEWIVVPNAHSPIINEVEHNKILELFDSRKRIYGKAQYGSHVLSGLLKCSTCGSTLHFSRTDKGIWIRKCGVIDSVGNKCTSKDKGIKASKVTQAIIEYLKLHRKELLKPLDKEKKKESKTQSKIDSVNNEINKINKALERLLELYEFGDIDRKTYVQRSNERKNEISNLEVKLLGLQEKTYRSKFEDAKSKIELIDELLKIISLNGEELNEENLLQEEISLLNKLLREIISDIVYHRENKIIELEISYI